MVMEDQEMVMEKSWKNMLSSILHSCSLCIWRNLWPTSPGRDLSEISSIVNPRHIIICCCVFFLCVCFTSFFVFRIADLPHSPGVVYYHLLLRRETRTPGVAPFSFRIGIWDLLVHRGQKSYTPTAFGKLWTTPGVRCMKHASWQSMPLVWDRAWNQTGDLGISGRVLYHWANYVLLCRVSNVACRI